MLDQALEDLLKRLTHSDQQIRWSATLVLGKLVRRREGEELREIVARVREHLRHSAPEVRSNTIIALGRMASGLNPELLDASIRDLSTLLKDDSEEVRSETVRALGEMVTHLQGQFPAHIKTVFRELQKKLGDPSSAVRAAALLGMGGMGLCLEEGHITDVVRIFVNHLKDPEAGVRMNAAWGLGKISSLIQNRGILDAVEALQNAEAAERNADARYHIQDALRALRPQDATGM